MSLKRNNLRGTPSGIIHGNRLLDCTSECRMKEHSLLVLCSAYLGNLKLLKHCATVCGNPLNIRDSSGRNALHVAASKGHLKLVIWLAAKKKVKIDVYDLESRWTALHRSIFYGQIGTAALLLKHGAGINVTDADGWSPLSILNTDRETFKHSLTVDAINVYTWGRNPNVTLGHDRTRKYPEKLDLSLSSSVCIIKVILCKFHSVFLSDDGQVLTCGHGPGGRLGHNSERSIVIPHPVKALGNLFCVGIAAARDHTVFLAKSGAVYTCGLNDAHQLGHGSNPTNAPVNCLAPKLVKSLKSKHIIAVGAGRYHTALCTETELYTVGKNLGQLGYEKAYETQVAPRAVSGINLDDDVITLMSVSDAATAVLTRRHHVFVCTNFIVKHIRLGFLDKLSCLQFEVCASLSDRDYLRKVETEPTKVVVLDSEHKLWLWEPTKRGSFPSVLMGFAKHDVSQFSLGRTLTVVTKEGEVYKVNGPINKPLNLQRVPYIQNATAIFTDFKANNFSYIQSVYRNDYLPVVSPSTLTSDLSSLLEEAYLLEGISDMKIEVGDQSFTANKFILNTQTHNSTSQLITSDVTSPTPPLISIYKLRNKCDNPAVFGAFLQYIYGSHIRLLPPLTTDFSVGSSGIRGEESAQCDGFESTPDTSFASVDENDLTEEYDKYAANDLLDDCADIEFMDPSFDLGQSTPKRKSHSLSVQSKMANHLNNSLSMSEKVLQLHDHQAELKSLLLLASDFNLSDLKKVLEEIMPRIHKPQTIIRPRLRLKRQPEFSDLTLVSKEGKLIPCHRCVLVARSEYFRSMLLMGWKESSNDITSLSMPVGYKVLKAIIDFIYTDQLPAGIKGDDSMEWVMAVLVMADQLLLTRLKELCEYNLAKMLNLRNAVDVLEFSETYSAFQLKKSCLQFICVNASYFLEGRCLDNVDLSLLQELTQSYHSLVPPISKRVIKFPDPDPEMLPESYFLDDKLNEDSMESGGSDNDEESIHGGAEISDVPSFQGASSKQETISLRASSNSRRKRKRKNSQSETKKRTASLASNSPPTSPVDDKSPTHTGMYPSPPNLASPVNITSPCSPLNASAPICTPKPIANNSYSTTSTPVSVQSNGSKSPISNGSVDEEVVLRASSVPGLSSLKKEKYEQQHIFMTPLSAREKGVYHVKIKDRTCVRLMNKFNSMTNDAAELPQPKKMVNGTSYTRQSSSPAVIEEVVKGPWASKCNGIPYAGGSLKEIMAKEEEIERRNRQTKYLQYRQISPPPSYSISTENGDGKNIGKAALSAKSQPVPIAKEASSTSNPWKTPESFPAVSIRDLMAEAEAEAKSNKRCASMNKDRKSLEEKSVKKPVILPHQQVSFASIIKSQESERNCRSPNMKLLSLIQIEERAISELELAYSAAENPDEFIIVKRCSESFNHQQQSQHGRQGMVQDSPWSRDI